MFQFPSIVRRLATLALLGSLLVGTGCSSQYLRVRRVPHNPLAESLNLLSYHGPRPSDRTQLLLRRYDLAKEIERQPAVAIERLRVEVEKSPTPDKIYSLAELSYIEALRLDRGKRPNEALDYYASAVAMAYTFLVDPELDRFRNPYDPSFRGACDLYNSSLESALRIAKSQDKLQPGKMTTISSGRQQFQVQVNIRGPWQAEEISHLEFVSDFEIEGGFTNRYHTYGLGVPLIAVRNQKALRGEEEKYYPPGLSFPVTAFLRVISSVPGPTATPRGDAYVQPCSLELYDPHYASDLQLNNRLIPLETDLTVPLAYMLDSPCFKAKDNATLGLLRPAAGHEVNGLYMLEPYDPQRIPVVMVHGLWSSPTTWMEMFNDLRAWPEIRDRYQFWFFLYPTGQPFWESAADLRQTLAEARATLDPQRTSPNFDEMVLVGHSMGGLLSRLQTIESGNDFWHILSDKKFEEITADAADREKISRTVYFHPNPSVKRVITLGTPHHGSSSSNQYTRFLGQRLISLPEMMLQVNNRVIRQNPGVFKNTELLTTTTSIDSLAPEAPIFGPLNQAPVAPWVHCHNVIGVLDSQGIVAQFSEVGDGVVSAESARWKDAETEVTVESDHISVHRHPRAILEVREILLQHDQQIKLAAHQRELAARPKNATPRPVGEPAGGTISNPPATNRELSPELFRLPMTE